MYANIYMHIHWISQMLILILLNIEFTKFIILHNNFNIMLMNIIDNLLLACSFDILSNYLNVKL